MKQILCNKYEILKRIAEGGMGVVYLVKDLHLNKLAAVKVSKNPGKGREREQVMKEMEMLRELSHPALPAITDFFEEEDNICLVMEYVDGITLEQYLRRFGRVETALAVKWAVELTEVLQYLHTRTPSVIYRDLKPANIMIQPDGRLKLIDFGAAFVSAYGQEKEELLMGTPGYGAPEQWQSGNAGKASDIYGLGAVLHEMLTGINPTHFLGKRRPVREYDKSISRELERIISICTKKRPGERYQSMKDLQRALRECGKKSKVKAGLLFAGKGIGAALFLAAAVKTSLPLIRGVKESEIPFPYLYQPLFLFGLAFLYRYLFLRNVKTGQMLKKQEKSVFLTEKKFPGIYVPGIITAVMTAALIQGMSCIPVEAGEGKNNLWVEMRDEQNRKLLLKEGAVYHTDDRVRLEIPADRMPEEELALRLVATGEGGSVYESRVFLLKGGVAGEE